jgi:hypothetical protein
MEFFTQVEMVITMNMGLQFSIRSNNLMMTGSIIQFGVHVLDLRQLLNTQLLLDLQLLENFQLMMKV